MKIIQRGRKPEDRTYRGTCHRCDTLVEFQQSEGKITHDQRDGDFISVTCPVCGNSIHSSLKQDWTGHEG